MLYTQLKKMVEYIKLKEQDKKQAPLVIIGKKYINIHITVLRVLIILTFLAGFGFGAWLI